MTQTGRIWSLYILLSESTGKLYTGITVDPDRRLREHNGQGKKGAKHTRSGRPWVFVYLEEVGTQGEALKRELQVKSFNRARKLSLISQFLESEYARSLESGTDGSASQSELAAQDLLEPDGQ